ncbi:MAG: hypothetical protein JKY37_03115 [Nannocystaceae bacterium]|nr:hypothetical protein [Nannocystaceae bacterium]
MLASELRYVGRDAEADAIVAEIMPLLQSTGARGGVAITEAGRFSTRVRRAVAGQTP